MPSSPTTLSMRAALSSTVCLVLAQPAPRPLTSLAWPLHGSAGAHGVGGYSSSEVPVGAVVPYGALRLGPDTTACASGLDLWLVFNHLGGYFYNDTCIRAFSHSHAQGAGEGDGGSLGAMITRTSPLDKGVAGLPSVLDPAPYRSNFSHSTETSQPGYYSSFLPDVNTLAELTAASGGMAGLHRYTCNSTSSHLGPCVLLLDGCHTTHDGPCGPGSMTLTNATNGVWTLSASLTEDGSFGRKCGGTPIFLYGSITATLTPARAGTWADGKLSAGAGTVASNGSTGQLGAWLEYSPIAGASVVITLRVAVSYVSLAGAAGNFAAQLANGTASFDGSRGAASSDWEAVLNTIVVNDVGYTEADVTAHRVQMDADAAGALQSSVMHRVPGAHPSERGRERVESLAAAALEAWEAKGNIAPLSGIAPPPPPVGRRSTPLGSESLGLPPHPIGMSPSDRLGSLYSSLYHAFSAPTAFSDVDGSYFGMDNKAHKVNWSGGRGRWMSDLSLWDVYRTQTPLLAILDPLTATDLFYSMAADYNHTGRVPHWVWANCETGTMPGSHGLAVLADYLSKGVPGPPTSVLLAAATAQLGSQDATHHWSQLGYVPLEDSDNGASLTMDYAYDDAVGALIADVAGSSSQAAVWRNRSKNYRNVWNPVPNPSGPNSGGMCPRWANGTFLNPCPALDQPPILDNKYYDEGDGLQYTFSVPHDVPGLISLFPSPAAYISLLQQMMTNTTMWPLDFLPNPWYWAGNEPGLLAPWQFSWVPSDSWRTQYWVRWVIDKYYTFDYQGVPGNDDFGALNSWNVYAILGLYPLTATPGGTYVLSSPCFANVTLQLPLQSALAAGYSHAASWALKQAATVPLLNIVAHNFSVSNVYIVRASLNGAPLSTPFVNHSQLFPPLNAPRPFEDAAEHAARVAAGAPNLLEFWLTSVPMVWGTGERAVVPEW